MSRENKVNEFFLHTDEKISSELTEVNFVLEADRPNSFTYFRSAVNNENKVSTDTDSKVKIKNRAYLANIKIFWSIILSRNSKLKVYMA